MRHTTATADAQVPARRAGWLDRLAFELVDRRLGDLGDGQLTVRSTFGTRTYGTGGDLAATVHVADPAFYRHLLSGGTLAAARAYVRGDWWADDVVAACRIFARNMAVADRLEGGWARAAHLAATAAAWGRRNTRRGSRRNIEAHYDLGNELFGLFLDDTLTYSCGFFGDETTTLGEAQRAKIDRLCQKLDLRPTDHLLEIGTGWGAFAIHAASRYGCRVTTTTISRQQFEWATARVGEAGLADRVTVLLCDYRDIRGTFDKLVSVEMIEAVGAEYLATFFRACAERIAPGGRMALQAITVPDARYPAYLRTTDFIRQDVFPGSCLVSRGAMADAAARAGLRELEGADDLTPHYARTLRAWRDRFLSRLDDVRRLGYPEAFIRRWEFYLASCEAGFAERTTGVWQVVFSRAASPGGRS